MKRVLSLAAPALGALVAGCNSLPFGQVAKYDATPHAAVGTITLSDAKVYSRETLINERTKEVARLQKLIDGVDQQEFKPDIVRETELITAFAASLGLRSDPAAGLTARRAKETADVQQEISTLQLQLQLEQLRKDAELLRSKLPEQTEPLNKDMGKLAADKPAAAASVVTAPSVEYLLGKIDATLLSLKDRFNAETKPIAQTTVSSNPFDTFRDRQAYLDMVRSARNASALDELHDLGNAALMRINLQAAVIPDPNYPKSLGAVEVVVSEETFNNDAKSAFLREWMDHINKDGPARTAQLFNDSSDAKRLNRAGKVVFLAVGGYEYALPRSAPAGQPDALLANLQAASWSTNPDQRASRGLMSAHQVAGGTKAPTFAALCDTTKVSSLPAREQAQQLQLQDDAYQAEVRVRTFEIATWLDQRQTARGQGPYALDAAKGHDDATDFLKSLNAILTGIPECAGYSSRLTKLTSAFAWGQLFDQLDKASTKGKARVYEVGPREQVQQMSTVARSASSLMLAATVAANSPSSGTAAEAALAYSRQAMGRATTLERIPSVVGYSVGGQQTFGWVFGPRAWLDPKGRIDVEQALKPYDLSVDLSVPTWWPSLKLKVTTVWGPSPQDLAYGSLASSGRGTRQLEIPMVRRAPDYDWFTYTIIGVPSRAPKIDSIVGGGPINACSPTTLLIGGRNLWRTDKVMVLGQLLDANAVTIAPDMDGIIVNVPAVQPIAAPAALDPFLHIVTPFGRDRLAVDYQKDPSGEGCKPKKAEAAADPTKPAIAGVLPKPLYFVVPSDFTITATGTALDKITQVTLHNQRGDFVEPRTATSLQVSFTTARTGGIPPGKNIELMFYTKDKDGKDVKVGDPIPVRITKK